MADRGLASLRRPVEGSLITQISQGIFKPFRKPNLGEEQTEVWPASAAQ